MSEEADKARLVPPDERLPVVAIVGRPNVGKSTFFNRLIGARKAIVEDEPGVTRDRNYAEAAVDDRRVMLIDTGGFDPDATDMIWSLMREQVEFAMQEADVILFLVDAQHGVTATDHSIYRMLTRTHERVVVLVNKSDNEKLEMEAMAEGYQLGVEVVVPFAAKSRRNLRSVRTAICNALPEEGPRVIEEEDEGKKSFLSPEARELLRLEGDIDDPETFNLLEEEEKGLGDVLLSDDEVLSVAVVGKPNAGKSTLVNQILGEDRLMTSNMPGTTRDSIDAWVKGEARTYRFVDTAGLRRKARISDRIERFSVIRAIESIRQCDVAVMVVDATEGLTEQDKKIAGLIEQYGRASVLLVNKWDLVEKDSKTADKLTKDLRYDLPYFNFTEIMYISAKSGQRVHKLYQLIERAARNHRRRVTTSVFNQALRRIVHKHPPPTRGTRRPRIFFGSQISVAPPTFLLFANEVKCLSADYRRYLEKGLRSRIDLQGTSIRLLFRERKRSPSKRLQRNTTRLHKNTKQKQKK
jgi:GTP-binding protein